MYFCILKKRTITGDNNKDLLNILKDFGTFSTVDIAALYRQKEPELKQATVNWRIYRLVQAGSIVRVSKGIFRMNNEQVFSPIPDKQIKSLARKLKRQFPYANLCLWDTSIINAYSQHLTDNSMYLVETDKEVAEPMFHYLQGSMNNIYLNPSKETMDNYLFQGRKPCVVKSMISEAPLQEVEGVKTVTMEKMLVDLFCDKTQFAMYQGHELRTIFQNCLERYPVNSTKILRYASRRGKREEIASFMEQIKRNN